MPACRDQGQDPGETVLVIIGTCRSVVCAMGRTRAMLFFGTTHQSTTVRCTCPGVPPSTNPRRRKRATNRVTPPERLAIAWVSKGTWNLRLLLCEPWFCCVAEVALAHRCLSARRRSVPWGGLFIQC